MITYKIYKFPEHPLTFAAKDLRNKSSIPKEIVNLLTSWEVAFSDRVIIVHDDYELMGFFRYDIGDNPYNIYAAGTYIFPKYRNLGLAFSLWEKMIQINKPKNIYAHIESDGGFKLIEKIKSKYICIKYDCTFSEKIKLKAS